MLREAQRAQGWNQMNSGQMKSLLAQTNSNWQRRINCIEDDGMVSLNAREIRLAVSPRQEETFHPHLELVGPFKLLQWILN